MSRRWILPLVFAVVTGAQQAPQKKDNKPAPPAQEQAPPEEDEALVPKEYSFNPLQAAKEVQAGNFYFKKGNYRAAARRFEEATKWDSTNAAAFLRLGEAKEKQHDRKGAGEAYTKYLEIAPDAKDAPEVKKRLEKTRK
jgi:tetratricopeptide (TPR) repeat protein